MAYQLLNKEGEAIVKEGKELYASDYGGVVKGVSLEDRTLRIVATDETRDRDGDIITMKGWRLDNYVKNPVFLWAHDYDSVPIAAALKIENKQRPKRLILTHKFPTLGVHPFADMILQLYHEKVVNAGSVGFIPFDWEEIKEEDQKFFGPKKFTDQELLEHSGCAVPANPNALQDSVSRAMKSLDFKYDDKVKLFKVVTGADILELDDETKEKATAEIGELIEKGAEYEEETKVQVQVPDSLSSSSGYSSGSSSSSASIDDFTNEEVIDRALELAGVDDPFVGIKNLVNEILDKHMADSLGDEKDIYRERADVLLKIGAVLSRKNKNLLRVASDNIIEVLDNAEPPSQETEETTAADQALQDEADDKGGKVDRFDVILGGGDGDSSEKPLADAVPNQESKRKLTKEQIDGVTEVMNKVSKMFATLVK